MLLQVSFIVSASLLLIFLVIVAKNVALSQLALRRFKKLSKGLPIYPDVSLVCNHSVSMLRSDPCNEILNFYYQDGHKTRGYLFNWRPAVITIDLDLMKTIVLDESTKHVNRIPLNLTFNELRNDNLMLAEDDQWRRLRRAFSQALKPAQFKTANVVAEIDASIKKLVDAIELKLEISGIDARKESVEINLKDLCHRYALNLVFSHFYKQHDAINFNGDCYWSDSVMEMNETFSRNPLMLLGLAVPDLQPAIDWLSWNFHKVGAFRRKLIEYVVTQSKQALEVRRQQGKQQSKEIEETAHAPKKSNKPETSYKRNMIDHVIDQYLDGKITKSEYVNSSLFLLNAANLTSADTIIHTLYVLAVHQDVQDRLRKSIRADGTESEYLTWVINESLRLRPPAPIGCSRTIKRDIAIDGGRYILPAGTFVTTPNYCIHRLKEYWGEDADDFKPDRWRDTTKHHPLQFIPFGAGARRCPGEAYALFEIRRLFVVLLSKYRFESDINEKAYNFDTPYLIFLLAHKPYQIRVQRL